MEQATPGQIKKYLKQLRQREEQFLYYLGQLAFQAGEQGKLEDPGMLEAYGTLKDIRAQVVQWEASLQQVKAAREAAQKPRCANCGELVKGAAFCPNCGAPVTAQPPAAPSAPLPAASTAKLCSACGAPLDDDAVFCGNCGAQVAGVTVPGAAQASASGAFAAPAPSAPGPAAPPADSGPKKVEAAVREPAQAPVEEDMPPVEETLACPNCGTPIPERDMRFCPDCGAKVRE